MYLSEKMSIQAQIDEITDYVSRKTDSELYEELQDYNIWLFDLIRSVEERKLLEKTLINFLLNEGSERSQSQSQSHSESQRPVRASKMIAKENMSIMFDKILIGFN